MIQDLDGVTPEPARRRHVLALTGGIAVVSVALLVALFVPPSNPRSSLQAAPSNIGPVMTIGSGSTRVASDPVSQPRDEVTSTECAAGVGSNPPVHLVLDGSGRVVAAYTGGRTGRFIPLPQAYVGSGWFTVPCDTSDVFAPRLNRAR